MAKKRLTNGFTIVEIAVVIFIIAILATLTLVVYNNVQMQSRDQKRKGDMILFVGAMDNYYQNNGEYPTGCSNATSANTNNCQAANALITAGPGLYQDTSVASILTTLPSLTSNFGAPRGNTTYPFMSSGNPDGPLMRYVYWGQLNSTNSGNITVPVMGGPGSTSGIDCNLGTSNISITMPLGPLPKSSSFFIAYHGESDNMWYIYQGKYGTGLTRSGVVVKGTTAGSCVFMR